MYLREEHVRYGLVKERLQRNLTSHSHAQPQSETANNPVENAQEELEPEATNVVEQFLELANNLAHAAEVTEEPDDLDDESIGGGSINLSLTEVFDLENSYWMDIWRGLAMRNLADEMEFHELIDLDGNAEADDGSEGDITLALV
jgi:hypothetical protein